MMQAGIGQSIVIKGSVTATENLVVSGRVEGTIEVKSHVLTVLEQAQVEASILAKQVVVLGHIAGDVEVLERIELRDSSVLAGDLIAPRISMVEGAVLHGTVDMPARS